MDSMQKTLEGAGRLLVSHLKEYLNSIVAWGVARCSQASSHTHNIKKQNRFIVVRVVVDVVVVVFVCCCALLTLFTAHTHTPAQTFYFSACTFFGLTLYLNFIFIFMLAKAQRHKKPFLVNSLFFFSPPLHHSLSLSTSLTLFARCCLARTPWGI